MPFLRPLFRYADFKGRASRGEFWGFYLFLIVGQGFCMFLSALGAGRVGGAESNPGALALLLPMAAPILFSVGTLIPYLAVTVRRLHDSGKSAWWMVLTTPNFLWPLLVIGGVAAAAGGAAADTVGVDDNAMRAAFISSLMGAILLIILGGIGNLILLVLMLLPGDHAENRFGPNPRDPSGQGRDWSDQGSLGGSSARIDDLIEEAKRANQAQATARAAPAASQGWGNYGSSGGSATPTFGRRGL